MKKVSNQIPLSREDRIWRIALLCCHTVRNAAYCQARTQRMKKQRPEDEYWKTVDGNFFDLSVLEWSKLFGEWNGHHHWRTVIEDRDSFWQGLLNDLTITKPEFESFREEVAEYRDRFVAHLDEDKIMKLPLLANIIKSSSFLYTHLKENEKQALDAPMLPGSIRGYEEMCKQVAEKIYTARLSDN